MKWLIALTLSVVACLPAAHAQSDQLDAVSREPIALPLAFRLLARSLGYGFIGVNVPDVPVPLDFEGVDGRKLVASFAAVHGLCHAYSESAGALMVYPPLDGVCPEVAGTVAVSPTPSGGGLDNAGDAVPPGGSAPVDGEGAAAPSAYPAAPASFEAFNIRLRVLEVNESRGLALGLDWSSGVFVTAAELVAGVADYQGGALPTPDLDDVVSFLETESVVRRLDDVTLAGFEGESVRFRSGGDVNVQLVGGGERNISKTFQFGLIVDATPKRLSENVVRLDYSVQDVDPGNVSDPTLITRNSQDLTGAQPVRCGESIVVGQFIRGRGESQGDGLPGLARVPLAGYVAGQSQTTETLRMYILTLDLDCRNVPAVAEVGEYE